MPKNGAPIARPDDGGSRRGKIWRRIFLFSLCAAVAQLVYTILPVGITSRREIRLNTQRAELLAKCASIHTPAGPPESYSTSSRVSSGSDRWVPGTPPTLLRNAKIWTGARNGTEIVYGDILLDKGLIVAVGYIPPSLLSAASERAGELIVQNLGGKWITPGIVDLHSHLGVSSAPGLSGSSDGNSRKNPILPWLRSIDGLNTHDAAYELAIAGGVTTAQVLPGSANNIGGQSFVIKLRSTAERSATSKVIEPPLSLTHSSNTTEYIRWRHMKHACGENPDRLYSQTRMDGQWNFRNAYNEARKIRDAQDAFCSKVDAGAWEVLEADGPVEFPDDLQWESLVDVLRGRVKLSIHCYEAVDLDGIVRLSNEFQFPVASFHHAGETYLVPDLLKKTWGGAPSIALFANNFRKKREAYRGSEFAPRVLAEDGIPVVMKSDHPVLNSRYLLYEAQQAHYFGLNPALALASVTSVPARAAGLGHRVGTIAEGYDADIVVWDSHPLALGATPIQVYIDGIAQLKGTISLSKPAEFQDLPATPDWDKEKNSTVEWEGLPPLTGDKLSGRVRITGVKALVGFDNLSDEPRLETAFDVSVNYPDGRTVIVEQGQIICTEGPAEDCSDASLTGAQDAIVIDLDGGAIGPGLTTYGSPLGLVEIRLEPSTNDGPVLDPLNDGDLPALIADTGLIRAVDGLAFEGRGALLAYRSGVTTAITAPTGSGFLRGVSTAFRLGAPHALSRGAIIQQETAVHFSLSFSQKVSVSTQVATLRALLFGDAEESGQIGATVMKVREGKAPLVISVENADIIATLLELKADYEKSTGNTLKLTFSGASEAHLLAQEIADAGVSVILTSPRPYPGNWEKRRILPGPPLSQESAVTVLLKAGVNVAIGVTDESAARNTRFDIAWVALEANGTISKSEALALASTNLHKALGLERSRFLIPDLVLYRGGNVLDFHSKPVGVISAAARVVETF
ncbi:hypothetical protein HYPSUDRAFT_45759 [Hypholoma sublateritium FD-334 SS-4]|uniref:Amidohydrolase-related domain-containing protein n=1 Tax=Hypholoma sublateritium (strain FD-334 SS-4) TaxID=945553 RepID=A0A0D2NMG5_HYPSF|nr:hypothetical protein HYPSUDRAFT_45759 [Hypholoma sublateritium FD-334 SS-4]